jgi:putative transposase
VGSPVPFDPLHERLAEAGAVTSIGSRGDSVDNALAESTIGLYKTELIR